jgi:hypothetical protein
MEKRTENTIGWARETGHTRLKSAGKRDRNQLKLPENVTEARGLTPPFRSTCMRTYAVTSHGLMSQIGDAQFRDSYPVLLFTPRDSFFFFSSLERYIRGTSTQYVWARTRSSYSVVFIITHLFLKERKTIVLAYWARDEVIRMTRQSQSQSIFSATSSSHRL